MTLRHAQSNMHEPFLIFTTFLPRVSAFSQTANPVAIFEGHGYPVSPKHFTSFLHKSQLAFWTPVSLATCLINLHNDSVSRLGTKEPKGGEWTTSTPASQLRGIQSQNEDWYFTMYNFVLCACQRSSSSQAPAVNFLWEVGRGAIYLPPHPHNRGHLCAEIQLVLPTKRLPQPLDQWAQLIQMNPCLGNPLVLEESLSIPCFCYPGRFFFFLLGWMSRSSRVGTRMRQARDSLWGKI